MKTKKALTVSILSALLLGAVIIMKVNSHSKSVESAKAHETISVAIAPVVRSTLVDRIAVTGTVEGINEADIISETSGRVVSIAAGVDDYLTAGGAIAQVENDLQLISLEQAQAQTAAASANSGKAQIDLKRIRNLYAQNAVSESQLENAELASKAALAQLRGAQAAEKLAQKHFDDTTLRTPIAGRVARSFVTVGKMITPGMKVATVVNNRKLKLDGGVTERDVSRIKKGDIAEITSDAVHGAVFHGKVVSVALKADAVTRTFEVEIEFPNDSARSMKSGMFARAAITASIEKDSFVVPASAIIENERGECSVFLVRNGRAAAREVAVGTRTDSLIVIVSGVVPGDTVITLGRQGLVNGSKVSYRSLN